MAVGKSRSVLKPISALRRLRRLIGSRAREIALLVSALNRQRNHPTVLVMPSHGRQDGASNLRGYLITERLRDRGWNAYICHPNLTLAQRKRFIRVARPNLILMQMARHSLNRPSLYDVPVVFDIDDADYVDPNQRQSVIEALIGSTAIIAGSRGVAEFCRRYNANVQVVWTGTPISNRTTRPQSARAPIVSWAALRPSKSPHEAAFMMDVLRRLVKLNNDFQFLLYCDDGSEDYRAFAAQFRTLNVNVITRPIINNYLEFLASLDDVAVGLAPLVNTEGFSGGKSFGKVLAYMDREVPIVTHPVVDHPLFFKNGENAYLLESADDWARGIAKLLADPGERQRLATGARLDLERRLSSDEAARRVDAILKGTLHEMNWPAV